MDLSHVKQYNITTESGLEKLHDYLAKQKTFSYDTETTGKDEFSRLNYKLRKMYGASFATADKAFWIRTYGKGKFTIKAYQWFNKIMQLPAVKIAHRATFDINTMYKYHIHAKKPLWCSRVMAYLYNEHDRGHKIKHEGETKMGLEALALKYLDYTYKDLSFKGDNDISSYTEEEQFQYGCHDAIACFYLARFYYPELMKQKLDDVFLLETDIVPIVAEMERNGIFVDVPYIAEKEPVIKKKLNHCALNIYEEVGEEFNMNSSTQKARILYDVIGLTVPFYTTGGKKKKEKKPSVDKFALEELEGQHPAIEHMMRYSFMSKIYTSYVLPFINQSVEGKIYASFDQVGTSTGRFSSSGPNLQNLPKEKADAEEEKIEVSRLIKYAVYAPKGWILICADYSQLEYRLMVHYSQCRALIAAYARGDCDVHAEAAAQVYDIPVDQVTKDQRQKGKKVNFATIYGQTDKGLAKELGIEEKEAAAFREKYFESLGEVKAFVENTIADAEYNGFVRTILGRKRRLRHINSHNKFLKAKDERRAVNTIIQGSATGDINKLALRELGAAIKRKGTLLYGSKIVLNVHDESVLMTKEENVEAKSQEMQRIMESVIQLSIPLKVDIEAKTRWAMNKAKAIAA